MGMRGNNLGTRQSLPESPTAPDYVLLDVSFLSLCSIGGTHTGARLSCFHSPGGSPPC